LVNPDDLLKEEKVKEARDEEIRSAQVFNFESVLGTIDRALECFERQDFVNGGAHLGWLRRAVIEHRDLFKE
jgi:hypothetical protein